MTDNNTKKDMYPIRTIFRKGFEDYAASHPLPAYKASVGRLIAGCKTGDLGYNRALCMNCGQEVTHASSCNNRNCPNCQTAQTEKWIHERNTERIEGIAYFHMVFTVPAELYPVIYTNQKTLYNLLFKASADTILTLCKDKSVMGAVPGIMSAIHTHGQRVNFHPHIHAVISGGGLTESGKFVETKHKGFLMPLKKVSVMFRGKFLSVLSKLYDKNELTFAGSSEKYRDPVCFEKLINSLYATDWNLFAKETFNGKGNAVTYLARYAYRSAISNSRIINVTDNEVTFNYKDYSNNGRTEIMTLSIESFIDRFMMHIPPEKFNRIRFYGFLTNASKIKNLKLINRLRNSIYVGNPYKKLTISAFTRLIHGKGSCGCPKCHEQLTFWPPGYSLDDIIRINTINSTF